MISEPMESIVWISGIQIFMWKNNKLAFWRGKGIFFHWNSDHFNEENKKLALWTENRIYFCKWIWIILKKKSNYLSTFADCHLFLKTITQSFLVNGTDWSFQVIPKGLMRNIGAKRDIRDLEWTIFRFLIKVW